MSAVTSKPASTETRTRTQAYVQLTKLRITIMVLLTFACAAALAAEAADAVDVSLTIVSMLSGILGMFFIACSGNTMNMYLERYSDFRMPRTSKRPLPAKELTTEEVVTFAAITFGVGCAFLFAGVNWQTGTCGVLNWILYVFVYTPLKRYSPLNTEVGAVAGAMPVLMGSLAATGSVQLIGWAFFGVLFLWQFPHFFAIAWMYREQYEAGGLKMLTNTEPTGRLAGIKSVVGCLLLIVVSLLPTIDLIAEAPTKGWWSVIVFVIASMGLGAVYLRASIRFLKDRETTVARRLLRSSLLYLPLYMLVLCLVYLV